MSTEPMLPIQLHQVVTYCEVQTGNVGKNSDGALVSRTGAACAAYNGWGGQGVIVSTVVYNTIHFLSITLNISLSFLSQLVV